MSNNKSILDFIKTNFNINHENLKNEVNTIFNNLNNKTCYTKYTRINTNITINGIETDNNIIDFTYLIPNLFRLCYIQNEIVIPNVCPTLIFQSQTTNYFPILLDKKYIQSFLYFNFPCNIKYHNNINNYVNAIVNLKNIIKKKVNTTYGSYTTAPILYESIYSKNSMLSQLILFNAYMSYADYTSSVNKIINTFEILWNYTTTCVCFTNNVSDSYIIGSTEINKNVTNVLAEELNNIRYSNFNVFNSMDYIHTNNYVILSKSNIFLILNYALEVYQDVLQQIQYFIEGEEYCRKDYMDIKNIPILLKMYKNFYKNQIYTNSKALPTTSVINVIPITITIQEYIDQFRKIYENTYKLRYFNKQVLLNGTSGDDAFVFYSNVEDWNVTSTNILWYYYYINVNNPSAVEIINNYTFTITYTTVISFANVFNAEYQLSTGYTPSILNTYTNGGLYPKGGTVTNPQNIGYVYKFTDSKGIIQQLIYETLRSYSPYDPLTENSGYGTALIYYTYSP